MEHLAHPWPSTVADARRVQETLRHLVEETDRLGEIRRVAGVDVGFEDDGRITRAAVAVLSFPGLELVEHRLARDETRFPYVPGYLSFREAPAALLALEKLDRPPDLLLCDGHGKAHPRRFGLACHLGVLTDLPTVGVAKSRLVGRHDEPPERKGGWVPLRQEEEIIGAVLRTRAGVKPVYVSIGHRISLETAIEYVVRCTPTFRLPETTRWADRLAAG